MPDRAVSTNKKKQMVILLCVWIFCFCFSIFRYHYDNLRLWIVWKKKHFCVINEDISICKLKYRYDHKSTLNYRLLLYWIEYNTNNTWDRILPIKLNQGFLFMEISFYDACNKHYQNDSYRWADEYVIELILT